ncbi:hypothetical protein GmHk_19G054038 [Glycine max]|nr:hypothetical protein GmHk_19G054038 [Glycine max]
MTVPTKQHETFQRVLYSPTHFLRNFLEGHPSHTCSKPSTLNCGILKCYMPTSFCLIRPQTTTGSHSTTLHTMTFHSMSLLLRTLDRAMVDPTNTRFFSVFYPHSQVFLKTSQKVTRLITTQSQTRLTFEFLSDELPKSRCTLLV